MVDTSGLVSIALLLSAMRLGSNNLSVLSNHLLLGQRNPRFRNRTEGM